MRRFEQAGIVVAILALVALPTAVEGWPVNVAGNAFTVIVLASGLTLVWWRSRPRLVAVLGGALWLLAAFLEQYGRLPESALLIMAPLATVTALGWRGRAAWVAGLGLAGYLTVLGSAIADSPVALVVFSVPGFLAGTVLRLRREVADDLAQRGRELVEERELFAELSLRHERARIAAELHDIIGHAISVMIIQAAAGQRLVDHDPVRARQALAAIADSAREGSADLHRLVALLGGEGGVEVAGPGLSLIEEVVTRAARNGLDVSCRIGGDPDGVAPHTAHIAFRVVQESLTNALRYAPGAAVRVRVGGTGRELTVRVENDPPTRERPGLLGTGHGLTGLRERVQEQGGDLVVGPTSSGGWQVAATLRG
jgi:signal transduction histidine kinase